MKQSAGKRHSEAGASESGSIVLFVLFVCLAVAVLVQALSAVVLCADRALGAEDSGRALMEQKDQALAELRQRALSAWAPMPWSGIEQAPEVQGAVADLPDSGGGALAASARQAPEVSPIVVSAWLERGRDGLDLPLAGLVAASAIWTSDRVLPWLENDETEVARGDAARPAVGLSGRLRTVPAAPLMGPGVSVGSMNGDWTLDEGWRTFLQAEATDASRGVAPGARVNIVRGESGATVELAQGWSGSPDDPVLLVVLGGASLDARGRGDLHGVIVVDGGDVLLDGTRIHGALFATGDVDFGTTGAVAYSRSILRWATDQSLKRVRLVPGTRQESTG